MVGGQACEKPNRRCCPVVAQQLHSDRQQRSTNLPGAGELVGVEQRLGCVLPRRHPLVERHQLVCKHRAGRQRAFSCLAAHCCRRARWGAENVLQTGQDASNYPYLQPLGNPGWLPGCNAPAEVASASLDATWFQYDLSSSAVQQQAQHAQRKRAPRWQQGQRDQSPTEAMQRQTQLNQTCRHPGNRPTAVMPPSLMPQDAPRKLTQVLGGDAEAGEGVAGDAAHKRGVGAHQLGLRQACVKFTSQQKQQPDSFGASGGKNRAG